MKLQKSELIYFTKSNVTLNDAPCSKDEGILVNKLLLNKAHNTLIAGMRKVLQRINDLQTVVKQSHYRD